VELSKMPGGSLGTEGEKASGDEESVNEQGKFSGPKWSVAVNQAHSNSDPQEADGLIKVG